MGNNTLPIRNDGQTIDASWFNVLRSALNFDLYPRNSSGIATDQAGSLGTSTERWTNAYLKNLILMDGAGTAKAVTLKAPAALTSNYNMILPVDLPAAGQNRPMQINDSGIITFSTVDTEGITDGAVTQTKLAVRALGSTVAAGGVAISGSCGSAGTSSTTATAISGLSVTIDSTGRPMRIKLESAPSSSDSRIALSIPNSTRSGFIELRKNSSIYATQTIEMGVPGSVSFASTGIPSSSISFLDTTPVIGSNTYQMYFYTSNADTSISAINAILVVYEI